MSRIASWCDCGERSLTVETEGFTVSVSRQNNVRVSGAGQRTMVFAHGFGCSDPAAYAPQLFESLVLVGPSPRCINDDGYTGGFSAEQIDELLEPLADDYMGWSAAMAPAIMGNSDRPELGAELTDSVCRTDPDIAKALARVTFYL